MAKVVHCMHCDQILIRCASHIKNKVFCSRRCQKAYNRPLVVCRGCGCTFERNVAHPEKLYCSWECFKKSRHVELTCAVCGKLFESYISEQRKRVIRNHIACCSRDCRNRYTSLLLGGDGTWVEKGKYKASRDRGPTWRKVRAEYLRLSRWTCEGCEGLGTIVHHLHPVAAGGDLYAFDNLMTVCSNCHKNMHEQLTEGAFWCSFEGVQYDNALHS